MRETCECVIESIDSCIAFLQSQCKVLRRAIDGHIQANAALRDDVARLRTIPAIGEKTANRMAAILTSYHFESAKEVTAFLGLVPVQRESGTSVRGPRVRQFTPPNLPTFQQKQGLRRRNLNFLWWHVFIE